MSEAAAEDQSQRETPWEDADETPEDKPPLSERLHDAIERETEAEPAEEDEVAAYQKALGEAQNEYRAKIREIVGEGAVLEPCNNCAGFGLVPFQLNPDPQVERCSVCSGHGSVLTGSLVDSRSQRPCPQCSGNGFAAKSGQVVQAPAAAPAAAPTILPPEAYLPASDSAAPVFPFPSLPSS